MKRIVFLDYVRVFACFLVMIVHASENFYGAAGSTDMAGPQSFLANEADRLWVSVYDGFSRMSVPLFMIVSAFLLAPMKEGQTTWQFYRKRSLRILPPFFVFMMVQFLRGIPRDLDESAYMDGCSSMRCFVQILLPLLKPALFSASLFQFLWTWNDFFNTNIYINSNSKFPLSLALRMSIDTTSSIQWNQVMAMGLVSILPLIILFFAGQRYFVEGIATTGMKN